MSQSLEPSLTTDDPWESLLQSSKWMSADTSDKLLGAWEQDIPASCAYTCMSRLKQMRDVLRRNWIGLDEPDFGSALDWVLAALLARENVLLLGAPGTAKTEIALNCFRLLGLKEPIADDYRALSQETLENAISPLAYWEQRRLQEREKQKWFHYLLSPLTQPEELFGPIEISLLRRGVSARVNFGLLTGPGVRGAFLDECFKASSSILNTLLTMMNERYYFNWGGYERSDLVAFIGASNEMPGGFGTGATGIGIAEADFQMLYAFLDRFPIRLNIPLAGVQGIGVEGSHLSKAFDVAIQRESRRFTSGNAFEWSSAGIPSINDLLLVGRYFMQLERDPEHFQDFKTKFLYIAASLMRNRTDVENHRITYTISPRKLKALYKVALAHAMVREGDGSCLPGNKDLFVFAHIWDTPGVRDDLRREVHTLIDHLAETRP